jgi:hypothetical protein
VRRRGSVRGVSSRDIVVSGPWRIVGNRGLDILSRAQRKQRSHEAQDNAGVHVWGINPTAIARESV